MATKTATTKEAPKQATLFAGEYAYAVGRRKTAIAQVRLYKVKDNGSGESVINDKSVTVYFPQEPVRKNLLAPLTITGMDTMYLVSARVRGGGAMGQAEAVRHAIARALVVADETLRPVLKAAGYLRRDPRMVERKKPGLKKARRATQWRKR